MNHLGVSIKAPLDGKQIVNLAARVWVRLFPYVLHNVGVFPAKIVEHVLARK
jgi:hypothetical protein